MDTYIDKVLKDNMGMKEFKTFWKINSVGYNKCNSKWSFNGEFETYLKINNLTLYLGGIDIMLFLIIQWG